MKVKVGISARHVHVTDSDVEVLFGKGYKLHREKDLSQPGQYACEERVTIVGPRTEIQRVRILGPEREKTQVEIEPEIQINEKFVLNDAVAQQQITTSRRRVVNEESMTIKGAQNVVGSSHATHKRNLELDENSKTDKTKHKRKLEL